MEIAQTEPSQLAVPFAELVNAASAWDGARRMIDDCVLGTRAADAGCCGPEVGPVLAERLARWRTEVALIGDAVADQAEALRACMTTSAAADADVARRFG